MCCADLPASVGTCGGRGVLHVPRKAGVRVGGWGVYGCGVGCAWSCGPHTSPSGGRPLQAARAQARARVHCTCSRPGKPANPRPARLLERCREHSGGKGTPRSMRRREWPGCGQLCTTLSIQKGKKIARPPAAGPRREDPGPYRDSDGAKPPSAPRSRRQVWRNVVLRVPGAARKGRAPRLVCPKTPGGPSLSTRQ